MNTAHGKSIKEQSRGASYVMNTTLKVQRSTMNDTAHHVTNHVTNDPEGAVWYTVIVVVFYSCAAFILLIYGMTRKKEFNPEVDKEGGDYLKDISILRERIEKRKRLMSVSIAKEVSELSKTSPNVTMVTKGDNYFNTLNYKTSTPVSPLVGRPLLYSSSSGVQTEVPQRATPMKTHVQLFLQRQSNPRTHHNRKEKPRVDTPRMPRFEFNLKDSKPEIDVNCNLNVSSFDKVD